MSLDEYRKSVQAQKECEQQFLEKPRQTSSIYNPVECKTRKTSNIGVRKLFLILAIIAIIILAVLKNPSNSDAKAEIKSMILEKVKGNCHQKFTDELEPNEMIGTGLSMLLVPTIIDNMVQMEVSNYVLFSTFDAKISFLGESKTLAAGIIIFGKVIPLKSEIPDNNSDQTD